MTSVSWAKNVSSRFLYTGQTARPVGGKRGRRSRVRAEALEYLASRVKEQPDLTLARLREDLEREYGIQIGHSQLWVILKRMGLRFKKSRSVPPNRTASESRPKGSSGGKQPDRSNRSALSSSTKAVSPRR